MGLVLLVDPIYLVSLANYDPHAKKSEVFLVSFVYRATLDWTSKPQVLYPARSKKNQVSWVDRFRGSVVLNVTVTEHTPRAVNFWAVLIFPAMLFFKSESSTHFSLIPLKDMVSFFFKWHLNVSRH